MFLADMAKVLGQENDVSFLEAGLECSRTGAPVVARHSQMDDLNPERSTGFLGELKRLSTDAATATGFLKIDLVDGGDATAKFETVAEDRRHVPDRRSIDVDEPYSAERVIVEQSHKGMQRSASVERDSLVSTEVATKREEQIDVGELGCFERRVQIRLPDDC